MALIINIYKFKGENKIHLAAELTSIQTYGEDCNNYVSYYNYSGSEKAKKEKAALSRANFPDGCGPKSGITAESLREEYRRQAVMFKVAGFGYNTKEYDHNNLTFVNRVIIPTIEDGDKDSKYSEQLIADQWKSVRPQQPQQAENQKRKYAFSISERHCGTIVYNILQNEQLCREVSEEFKETSNKNEVLINSLENTIHTGCREAKPEFFQNFYLKDDLLRFYNNHRLGKSFWERDSDDYRTLLNLCRETKEEKEKIPCGFIAKKSIPPGISASLESYLAQQLAENKTNPEIKKSKLLINQFINSLEIYKNQRKEEKDEYTGFFKQYSGYSKTVKLNAVDKVLKFLKGEGYDNRPESKDALSRNEYEALFDGKLYTGYISEYKDLLKGITKKKEYTDGIEHNFSLLYK